MAVGVRHDSRARGGTGQGRGARATQDIHDAEAQIARIDAERQHLCQRGALDKATEDTLLQMRKNVEAVRDKAVEAAKNRISYYWNDFKEAKARQGQEYAQVMGFLQRTTEAENYFAQLPSSIKDGVGVAWKRWTVDITPDEAVMRLKEKVATLSIGVHRTDSISMEAGAAIDIFNKVRAFVWYQTRYGPDGVEWTPSFHWSMGSDSQKTTKPADLTLRDSGPTTNPPPTETEKGSRTWSRCWIKS